MPSYDLTAELPDLAITWEANDQTILDFSAGYTFKVDILDVLGIAGTPGAVILTQTTGITSAAIAPNVTIAWPPGAFAALPAGTYNGRVTARQTASGKDRVMTFILTLA